MILVFFAIYPRCRYFFFFFLLFIRLLHFVHSPTFYFFFFLTSLSLLISLCPDNTIEKIFSQKYRSFFWGNFILQHNKILGYYIRKNLFRTHDEFARILFLNEWKLLVRVPLMIYNSILNIQFVVQIVSNFFLKQKFLLHDEIQPFLEQ